MSKHQHKPVKAKPISANPLFPAVVALWFGALFGLGSLAVRPSLLEDLVLKSHIDLIVPAAAPPLGVTARILFALIMAALGAVLGISLARRLARPKPELHERKRSAKDFTDESPRLRQRDSHPDAPARRPISAHEELGGVASLDAVRPNGGLLTSRRRSLAIMDEENAFVPHEAAPLPGLDAVQPLDLATLALPVDSPAEPAPDFSQQTAVAAPALDWTRPAPVAVAVEPNPITPEAAHLDGRQVFGMGPPPAPEIAPRQIFGVQAEDDHLPQDFVKAAGFQTSVFDTPEPSPLFGQSDEAVARALPVAVTSVPLSDSVVAPAAAVTAAPVATASEPAVPLPSPSSLGMTDLAARLADSMRRRRERAEAAPAQIAPAEVAPEPLLAVPPMPELPVLPAAFAAPPEFQSAPAEPALARFAECAAAIPVAAPQAPLEMPASMRPLALDAFLEDDTGLDASLLPPRHIAVPAALQVPAPFGAAAAQAEVAPPVGVTDSEAPTEATLADVEEDNPYASLLGVAPVRQAHVRIEEPELAADAEIEPVVIFPGQTGQVVPLTSPAAELAGGEEGGFRRFDAPGSAGQGQPVATGMNPSLIPAEEAAQALRAALSNLQRMSGAA